MERIQWKQDRRWSASFRGLENIAGNEIAVQLSMLFKQDVVDKQVSSLRAFQ
jgi:hypothetical protein